MQPSDNCYNLIKKYEDCKLQAYPDPGTGAEPWTIGWGSTGPDIKKGTVWTQKQADDRLKVDTEKKAAAVNKLLGGSKTSQNQFDALVDFAYNLGEGNLAASTLLKLHKIGNYRGASAQFVRWNKANGKVLNGLTKRRLEESTLYSK